MVYAYLIGDIYLAIIWLILYLKNKNLKKEMLFGSILYPSIIFPLGLITMFLSFILPKITWRYVPDYFNPDTLFNLSRITKFGAIEDILFMFFAGGIIAIIYEIILKKNVIKVNKRHHILSIVGFFTSYLIIAFIFTFNPIYNLIISGFIGFIIIVLQRQDLIKHSLYGAIIFTTFYFISVIIFNIFFPDVINTFWTIKNLSGIIIFKTPIEELLYAFSFGLMWAPMYEYIKAYKTK